MFHQRLKPTGDDKVNVMQNLYFKQGTRADLPAVLRLQKLCYQSEAALYNDYTIQPLTQTIEELYRDFDNGEKCRIALLNDELIGAVRGLVRDHTGYISKLIVAPEYQNRGIGKQLMQQIEMQLSPVSRYELFTGSRSKKNLALYQKLGYTAFREQPVNDRLTFIFLQKYLSECLK